jgi:hypothetical protein
VRDPVGGFDPTTKAYVDQQDNVKQTAANLYTDMAAANALEQAEMYVDGKALDEFAVPAGSIDMNGQLIVNMADAIATTDAATLG